MVRCSPRATSHAPLGLEAGFRRAIEVARRQQAKLLELRAATALGRLLSDRGETPEARDLLTPLCRTFDEVPEFADLNEAKALLAELS